MLIGNEMFMYQWVRTGMSHNCHTQVLCTRHNFKTCADIKASVHGYPAGWPKHAILFENHLLYIFHSTIMNIVHLLIPLLRNPIFLGLYIILELRGVYAFVFCLHIAMCMYVYVRGIEVTERYSLTCSRQ